MKKIENGVNYSKSIFIARNGEVDTKVDLSYVYNLNTISSLLTDNNFNVTYVYSDFAKNSYIPGHSERMLIVGSKLE